MSPRSEAGGPAVQLTVTVQEEHLARLDEVATELGRCGMQVDQELGGLGIITGSAPGEALAVLRGIEGVASVDAQVGFSLPPPDSPVQ